ncbi:hypothetical protein AZA_41536 [Nitrospirillum viridazoti Y2]|uniref:Lipoprotein n=1 Tax=Nitrospirillum amazonense TaxID=28077 RepID=A0A560HXR1_9PROT|nr:hypothetical protein [Nitrospirillum amazonense]EGY01274.1 hypothetical protein AZA_41536 [Nitrospirillum amazonense Y2]TWB51438.1 hypothetical protein FBZ92_12031 [Nitrospirillum amazonense]
MSKVKITGLTGLGLIAAIAITGCAGGNSNAGVALGQASQAGALASGSAVHVVAASGQAALGMSSVPLAAGGAVLGGVGNASTAIAKASMTAASAPSGKALPVTDQTITVVSPNTALEK